MAFGLEKKLNTKIVVNKMSLSEKLIWKMTVWEKIIILATKQHFPLSLDLNQLDWKDSRLLMAIVISMDFGKRSF